jgi:L-threonylcarbamoyladenylate synthase
MLDAHYAPECRVVAVDDRVAAETVATQHMSLGDRVGIVDRTDDLVVAARRLYDDLRAADAAGLDLLLVVLPPAVGLGHAIRDRVLKAAAAPGAPSRER